MADTGQTVDVDGRTDSREEAGVLVLPVFDDPEERCLGAHGLALVLFNIREPRDMVRAALSIGEGDGESLLISAGKESVSVIWEVPHGLDGDERRDDGAVLPEFCQPAVFGRRIQLGGVAREEVEDPRSLLRLALGIAFGIILLRMAGSTEDGGKEAFPHEGEKNLADGDVVTVFQSQGMQKTTQVRYRLDMEDFGHCPLVPKT